MMGVSGILGGALLSAIHGATVVNTIYEDGNSFSERSVHHSQLYIVTMGFTIHSFNFHGASHLN